MVQLRAQARTSKTYVIIVQKTIKCYTYCQQDYYIKDKYHDKYLYFKQAKVASTKSTIK